MPSTPNISPERVEKLEKAVKAAVRLRKAIEKKPREGQMQVAMLLVPVAAVDTFDEVMESLK